MDTLVPEIFAKLKEKRWMIATAESCTGGLISWALTEVPGSSEFVDRGFVTYSNAAKSDMLGVAPDLIEQFGAVSEPVARAMVQGALRHSKADIAIAVTGIAGPGGGTAEKPVGLIYIAIGTKDHTEVFEHHFSGERSEIRVSTVTAALVHTIQVLS
ncbi:MAG TPA: CinA family protein [Alphaproteobacteria bacterium]